MFKRVLVGLFIAGLLALNIVPVIAQQFPGVGSDEDCLTYETSLPGTVWQACQPLDADLTAIAALTTTAAGRSILTFVDPNADAVIGWDDSAGALEALTAGEILAVIGDIPLGTNTSGDYVKDVADGTGIDGTATGEGSTYTPTFDATELTGTTTFGAGAAVVVASDLQSTDDVIVGDDLTFASGAVIDWASSDVTLTHSANTLTITGGITAIDDLSTIGGQVFNMADNNLDQVMAWDDSAGEVIPIPLATLTTEASPASGDYLLIYGAEGDLRKANWSTLPGVGGGINNVVEDLTPQLGGFLDWNGQTMSDATLTDTLVLDLGEDTLSLTNDAADGTGVILKAQHDSATPADGDIAFDIQVFAGADDEEVGRIALEVDDGSTTTEDTRWRIFNDVAGSSVESLIITGAAISAAGSITAATDLVATAGDVTSGDDIIVGDDIQFAANGVINFDAGDVTITHSANDLAFAGVTGDYSFDDTVGVTGSVTASVDVTATTGDVTSGDDVISGDDVLLSNAGVINFGSGDCTLTEGTDTLTIAGTCVLVTEDAGLQIGASVPFSDSAGTLTLQNVDALEATTEGTVEAAIDTLANLVSVQSLTVTLADAGANAIFGWDDVAGAYENLTAAEALAVIEATTPLVSTAEGNAAYQPLDADLTTLSTAFTTASGAGAASLALHEDTDNGTNRVLLQGAASTADVTLTLQATTGTVYSTGGTDVAVADGGTGASTASGGFDALSEVTSTAAGKSILDFADPGADAIIGWDDSAGQLEDLTVAEVLAVIEATTPIVTQAEGDAAYQPLDADLTSIAALTTTAAGRDCLTMADSALDEIVAWDDSAGACETIALADITTEASPAAGDYVLIYGAEGDLRKVDWSNVGGGSGANTALSNLAAVAINTTLVSDTDNTDDLGTSSIGWKDIYLVGGVEFRGTTDTTLTAPSAGELTLEGDAVKHAGKQMFWVGAGAFRNSALNPASCGDTYDSGTQDVTIPVCAFDTGATEENAEFGFAMPKASNESTITMQVAWTNTGGSSTQTVQWKIACTGFGDDDALNTAYPADVTVSDTWTAQNDYTLTAETSAITIQNLAENDYVNCRVGRDTSADDMSGDALLIGVKVYWTDAASTLAE